MCSSDLIGQYKYPIEAVLEKSPEYYRKVVEQALADTEKRLAGRTIDIPAGPVSGAPPTPGLDRIPASARPGQAKSTSSAAKRVAKGLADAARKVAGSELGQQLGKIAASSAGKVLRKAIPAGGIIGDILSPTPLGSGDLPFPPIPQVTIPEIGRAHV